MSDGWREIALRSHDRLIKMKKLYEEEVRRNDELASALEKLRGMGMGE